MTDRNIERLKRDSEEHSDKSLYPYLKPHIFGPYHGDCYAYLTELKYQLQENGFEGAKLCADKEDEPPHGATEEEENVFWWEKSREFLDDADVAIFVFLDHIFTREGLPDRAREKAKDVEDSVEINSSVIVELVYWLQEDVNRNRTIILFENGIYEEMGSLIPGLIEEKGLHYPEPIESVDEAVIESREICSNLAMGELRTELRKRRL
jgi:hypothetical protein